MKHLNKKRKLLFFSVLLCVLMAGKLYAGSSIKFIKNLGQWDAPILFKTDIPGGQLFIGRSQLTYVFVDRKAVYEHQHGARISSAKAQAVSIHFEGAGRNVICVGGMKLPEYFNFFTGKDPSKWKSNVPAFQQIVFKNLYRGIDLEITSLGEEIKSNFIVHPGANPSAIKLRYEGADELSLENGALLLKTWVGNMREAEPVSYQRSGNLVHQVSTSYVLNGNRLSYKLGLYNTAEELVIDPQVVFGTYVGSTADNFGFCSTFDNGSAYAGGTVYGANFPNTTGRYQASFAGGNSLGDYARDVIIAKFNPTGTSMLWATYLGGTDNEQPHSICTNGFGDLLIFGSTASSNFPVTGSAYDTSFNGGIDVFVAKLSSNGTSLMGSTFFGGIDNDGISGAPYIGYPTMNGVLCYNYADWYRGEIVVDAFNNVYIASTTHSSGSEGFPVRNAFQSVFGGGTQDGFIAKFNSGLNSLSFSSYIGGSGEDACYGLSLDVYNSLFVTGGTNSGNMAVSNSSFPFRGDVDGFIAKTTSNAGSLEGFIYVGTNAYDQSFLVQNDANGDVYITGQTAGNMSATASAYSVSGAKQFIRRYDNNLSTLKTSSTFGRSGASFPQLSPSAFLVDACGRVYFSGWGGNTNLINNSNVESVSGLPTTTDAFQRTTDGSDFYLMVLGKDMTRILYSTYYGGSISPEHVDGGTSHFDKNFIVYQTVCAGCWGNSDFPTTPGAYSRINPARNNQNPMAAGCNIGVFKFDLSPGYNAPSMPIQFREIVAGDSLDVFVTMSDVDGDSIHFVPTFRNVKPGANSFVFSDTVTGVGFTTHHLRWFSKCSDISSDTIFVDYVMLDNSCPSPKAGLGVIKIIVKAPEVTAPYPECLSPLDDNTLKIQWMKGSNHPKSFGRYVVMRALGTAPANQWSVISTLQDTFVVDFSASNHRNVNYQYFIIAYNNCNQPMDTSRTVSSIIQLDTLSNPGFSNMEEVTAVLNLTDTFNYLFNIDDTDGKDSLYLEVNGSLINKGKASFVVMNGLGRGTVWLRWITTCDDLTGDTNYLYVTVKDNQCPVSRSKTKLLKVLLNPIPNDPMPELECAKLITDNEVEIAIPALSTFSKYLKEIKLLRLDASGNRKEIGKKNRSEADVRTVMKDPEAHQNTQKQYCYFLEGINICDQPSDSSQPVCTMSSRIPPAKLRWYTVTVKDDREVKLVWKRAADSAGFWKYKVLKKQDRESVDYLEFVELSSFNDTFYIDESTDVDKHSYCYQVVQVDQCGVKSQNNDEACSILLKGVSEPVKHHLLWQDYPFWPLGVSKFELYRADAYSPVLAKFPAILDKGVFYTDNNLDYNVGLYNYQIVAYQNPNTGNATSESNIIELVQAPYAYVPNAYTPNGDGLNDSWRAVHAFVKEFNMKIFNRWGQQIFETSDKNESFRSIYNNQSVTNDVFVYLITFTGWDGSTHTLKGNFTLLR